MKVFFFCGFRVKEDASGNITMKETGSKPLKRDDLDSDVSHTEMPVKDWEHNRAKCISDTILSCELRFTGVFACLISLESLQETLLQYFISRFALCVQ